jgi:hypothetical protein
VIDGFHRRQVALSGPAVSILSMQRIGGIDLPGSRQAVTIDWQQAHAREDGGLFISFRNDFDGIDVFGSR